MPGGERIVVVEAVAASFRVARPIVEAKKRKPVEPR